MDSVSSIIDGSIAVAGIVAALAVSGWALMVSPSPSTDKNETAVGNLRTTGRKAA